MEPPGGPLSTQCTPLEEYSKGQKPSGPAAPRVFGLWSGLGCGLGLAFRKSLGGPSIFSLGSTLSTLGKLPRGSIHHATSSAFPQIVPLSGLSLPGRGQFLVLLNQSERDRESLPALALDCLCQTGLPPWSVSSKRLTSSIWKEP